MEESQPLSELTTLVQTFKGKSIISISNGQTIGTVNDILIDPKELRISAIVTSKGSLLSREIDAILADDIRVWGKDVILVSGPDIIQKKEDIPDLGDWLSVSNQIKGREVFSLDGLRVGEINDLVVDMEGNLVSYDLVKVGASMAEAMVASPEEEKKRLPINTTHAMGKDVLIVDLAKGHQGDIATEFEH
ncbi:MAG: PRC-barrel domain-containing protein [Anaerolineales bacterium]